MAQKKTVARSEVPGILEQFRASGLTQKEFAKQEGVSASTLAFWIRREKLERQLKGETTLVAVAPSSPSPGSVDRDGFIVEAGGVRVLVPRDASLDEWKRLREVFSA